MRVDVLVPDAAPAVVRAAADGVASSPSAASAFARLIDAAGAILERADRAETAFAQHRGGLAEMVIERARADVALQVATGAAQRTVQSLTTLLGMQL